LIKVRQLYDPNNVFCSAIALPTRAKGYKTLRITTGAENHAMGALAGKFGAHLAFRDGEATGTIDLIRQQQADAKLASAPFAGTRAVMNFSRVYRTLLSAIAAGVYRDAKDFIAGVGRGFRMTRRRLGYRL
jgi:hypothetical protein